VLAARVPADAQNAEQNPTPSVDVMNYKAPTGPEMAPLAAASGVVRFARMAEQYGTVMALIVDAHTGFVEGRYVGSETPPISELGPVATMNIAAESATAFAASARARERAPGNIIGKLYVHGHTATGWRIVIARSKAELTSRPVKTLRTKSGGEFFVKVQPGTYVIGAENSKRRLCGVHSFTVPARPETYVTVRCR
jgi:hypothetical protein